MTDDTTQDAAPPHDGDPLETDPKDTTPDASDASEGALKALRAERKERSAAEARAKAAEARLQEIEDAQKSEAEKLLERATRAEQDAASARTELLRERIAREEGVPATFIDRLRGESEDEIRDDAKLFVAALPAREGPDTTTHSPRARDGGDPDTTEGMSTDDKLARAYRRGDQRTR